MSSDIDEQLQQIGPRNPTALACNALFQVLPHVAPLREAHTMAGLVAGMAPGAPASVVSRAQALAGEDPSRKAIWMVTGLDAGDGVVTILTSVKSALALYSSRKEGASAAPPSGWAETQGLDAAVKVLAFCHLLDRLFAGEADPLRILLHLETGRALVAYMATVEVTLPFITEAVRAEGLLAGLVAKHGEEASGKLGSVIGAPAVDAARQRLGAVVAMLDAVARDAAAAAVPAASSLERSLPVGLRVLDVGGDVFAAGADVLPVYRYLGVRLVAETAALRALREAGLPVRSAEADAWLQRFGAPAIEAAPTVAGIAVAETPALPPLPGASSLSTPALPPLPETPPVPSTPALPPLPGASSPSTLALPPLPGASSPSTPALPPLPGVSSPSTPALPPLPVSPPPPPVGHPPFPVMPPVEATRPAFPVMPPLSADPPKKAPVILPPVNPPPPPVEANRPLPKAVEPARPPTPPVLQLPPEVLQPTYTREEPVPLPEKRGISPAGIAFALIAVLALGCGLLFAFGVGSGLFVAADDATSDHKPDTKKPDNTKKPDRDKKNDKKPDNDRRRNDGNKSGKTGNRRGRNDR